MPNLSNELAHLGIQRAYSVNTVQQNVRIDYSIRDEFWGLYRKR
jgi:hypothetical protein